MGPEHDVLLFLCIYILLVILMSEISSTAARKWQPIEEFGSFYMYIRHRMRKVGTCPAVDTPIAFTKCESSANLAKGRLT